MDGYAAGEKGEFDQFNPSPENLDFVCSLTDDADSALAGRISYQMLESYWPSARDKANANAAEIKYSNWYNEAEKIVLSKTLSQKELQKTIFLSEDIESRIREIKNREGKNILMFGSPTAFELLNNLELIDEYWIIQYPVLFGKGLPFFSGTQRLKRFQFVRAQPFSKGELALHYKTELT